MFSQITLSMSTCVPLSPTARDVAVTQAQASLVKLWFGLATANLTMTTITIEQAEKYDGQEVTIRGWLYNLRESGKLMFPIFRDGTGIIQGVCALKENPEAHWSYMARMPKS